MTAEFSVMVFDMAHTGDPDGEHTVSGFASEREASAYAEARVRDSVEALREPDMTSEDLIRMWHIYGEDCSVIGGSYKGWDNLSLYAQIPATPAECDWSALTPRLRRYYAALLIGPADKSVWQRGFFRAYRRPDKAALLERFGEAARKLLELPEDSALDLLVASLFELPDPPALPVSTTDPVSNWLVSVQFVVHDIKFGSSAQAVFQWPGKPVGPELDQMVKVAVSDKLAMRGDGPAYFDYADILGVTVEATEIAVDLSE